MDDIAQIKQALSALRVPPVGSEYDLHELIAQALAGAGIAYRHEVPIAPRCRIDFLCGTVGIEVKQGKHDRKQLAAQAGKYLQSEAVESLLLVTRDGAMLPGTIAGKRVEVFGLSRLWGLALP